MDHLDHVNVFREDNEDILSGHGEPALNLAFEANKVIFGLADSLGQHIHIGDTDLFLAGQQYMDVTVLNMTFPDRLVRCHGLVIKAIDKSLIPVDFVSAFGQLGEICGQQIANSGIQTVTQAEIAFEILPFCINQIKLPLLKEIVQNVSIFS